MSKGQDRPILLHIGYHKTATTWMQNLLFQPVHGYRQLLTHQEVFEGLLRPHGLQFSPEAMRREIAVRKRAVPKGEVPVVSSELMSGNPFFGGRESDIYAYRLREVMPEARILISIRSQMRILPSVYMQYVRRGGTMSHPRFFDGETELGYFGFSPEHFEYDRLIGLYQNLFGRENVHVLPQESLQKDMDAASAALARFAGNVPWCGLSAEARRVSGASDPEYSVPVLRRVNHVRASALHHEPFLSFGAGSETLFRGVSYLMRRPIVSRFLKNHKPVTAYVRKRFGGHFDGSNARLRALLGTTVDLTGYGPDPAPVSQRNPDPSTRRELAPEPAE